MLRPSCAGLLAVVLLVLLATAAAGSVLRQDDGSSGDHKECHKNRIRKRTLKMIKARGGRGGERRGLPPGTQAVAGSFDAI